MTIDLSKVAFTNDFFSTMLPDGSTLFLNKVNEDFITPDSEECVIKAVNLEVIDSEENAVSCPCVIGLSNDILSIQTEHKEYEGEVLTPENMVYCTIEIYEE